MLEISNITFGYKKGMNVLENFSLSYNEPGIYGLLGKNGTGKSTLLYLMVGLLRAQHGTVTYNGISTIERRPEVLEEMFIVPEDNGLFLVKFCDVVTYLVLPIHSVVKAL